MADAGVPVTVCLFLLSKRVGTLVLSLKRKRMADFNANFSHRPIFKAPRAESVHSVLVIIEIYSIFALIKF